MTHMNHQKAVANTGGDLQSVQNDGKIDLRGSPIDR